MKTRRGTILIEVGKIVDREGNNLTNGVELGSNTTDREKIDAFSNVVNNIFVMRR